MKEKVTRLSKRAAEGKHAPIIAKSDPTLVPHNVADSLLQPSGPAAALGEVTEEPDLVHVSALNSLNDEKNLAYAREAFEFLDSSRLFHCHNCDEEWLVFDQEWPQGGVEFAGSMAGSVRRSCELASSNRGETADCANSVGSAVCTLPCFRMPTVNISDLAATRYLI
jgi:hypothetical protein